MSKRQLIALVIILTLAGFIYILINNKAKMTAKSQAFEIEANSVAVMTLVKRDLEYSLSQVGLISAYRDVPILAETQGKVVAVRVKVGSPVTVGSVIVQIDDELPRAKYNAAQANYEKAKKDYERMQTLRQQEIISDAQLESYRLGYQVAEAEFIAAKRQYGNAAITSPVNGVVSARLVDLGNMVSPGTPIANVVDISRLKVKLSLAESDAFRIKVGDRATIATDVYPGVEFSGWVESISAKGDQAHTYPVEVTLNNDPRHPLKAGMFGKVTFAIAGPGQALVIPREALVGSIKEPQVYVVEAGVARLREIILGGEYGTDLVILEGLKEGETLVVNGQNNLVDKAKVTVVFNEVK